MQEEDQNDLRHRRTKKAHVSYSHEGFSSTDRNDPKGLLPNSVGYGVILFFLIGLQLFVYLENVLPKQLQIADADSHSGRFIGERAELQLKRLTSLGPRVVGSYENEVLVLDFLKREVSFISQQANKIHKIETDIQRPSGSYYLIFKQHGFRNYYANIQNFVVKLSSGNSTNSILMNCHYDTAPESPGASDNGINCVVMLEILRVLATETKPLKNNVIFLFNGAEENPLQASHGFLTKQKWRNEVKVLINLDSGGAGGREVLFQTSGEPWLVKAYAEAVPYPSAKVQAEEMFHYGIIPSDTDFRIFRDFGNYSGFDIAHYTNGYIYHTKYDKMDFIKPGVYQNTGDNLLALVKHLINSPELGVTHSKTRIVYFDIFTLFMVVYTEEFSILLNFGTILLSCYTSYKTLKDMRGRSYYASKSLAIAAGGQVLGLVLAMGVVFIIAKTLDATNSTMSWYIRLWLIIPLYSFPIALAQAVGLLISERYLKKDLLVHKVILFIIGSQMVWSFLISLGTLSGYRTSYILMLFVLFPSVGILFVTFLKKHYSVKAYLITFICGLAFPVMYILCQVVSIFQGMVPMTGRMGPHINAEFVVGVLTYLTSAVTFSFIIPFLMLIRNFKGFLFSIFIIHFLTMMAVIKTEFGFPYSDNVQSPAFQRFYVLHCERTFHDARGLVRKADSGVFVQSLDRNNIKYLSEFIPELEGAPTAGDLCPSELFCGFPLFTSRFIKPAPYSYWLSIPPPTIHHPTSLEIVNQTQILVNIRRLRILVTGPDHITVGLSPRKGINLVGWSLDRTPPVEVDTWNGRNVYMVYYSHGLVGGTLEFDLDLQIDQNHMDQLLDIAVVGHYMHDKKFRTEEFKKVLSRFPKWAHVTPWTTTFKSWVI